jgi:TM2 domain-containing membrane protein YozV
MNCPSCNTPVDETSAKFCPKCGAKLSSVSQATTTPVPSSVPKTYCRNCGKELQGKPEICMNCGAKPLAGNSFCPACGTATNVQAVICVKCGTSLTQNQAIPIGEKSKLAAGLLGIFLGGLGIHRFYLGFIGIGIVQIIVTLITVGFGGLWGFIEGILILTGSFKKDAKGRLIKGD